MPTPVRSWSTPSSDGAATYETVLYDDGSMTCECKGFFYSRDGKPKACKHTKRYAPQKGGDSPVVRYLALWYLTNPCGPPRPRP